MTDNIPDPFKDYIPKPNPETLYAEQKNELTSAELDKLDAMTVDQLKTLAKRLLCSVGTVALMSEDDIRQAFLDRMARIGLTGKAVEALAAMEKRMDRVEGKAHASIAITNTIKVEPLSIDEAAKRIAFLLNSAEANGTVIDTSFVDIGRKAARALPPPTNS